MFEEEENFTRATANIIIWNNVQLVEAIQQPDLLPIFLN